jgi:hypothetical protein
LRSIASALGVANVVEGTVRRIASQVRVKEPESVFRELTISVNTPGGVNYGELVCDPFWDPLRNDPRFDKLLAQLAPHD